jgi:hypothetical protein
VGAQSGADHSGTKLLSVSEPGSEALARFWARAYNSEFQDLSNSFNPGIRCYMRKWPTNNSFSHHIPGNHPKRCVLGSIC